MAIADLKRRLTRMEDRLGVLGCSCGGPQLVVVRGDEPEPPAIVCPVHPYRSDRLVVRIKKFAEAQPCVSTASAGNVMPPLPGRVFVDLPPPGVMSDD